MSGNHYKGHEVSCCIKYFIFGFNILFWRCLWTKAVVFHLTLGYTFPPFYSPPQGDYFSGRRAGGSSRDGPSVSG